MPASAKTIYLDGNLRLERPEPGKTLCATLPEGYVYAELSLNDAFFTTMAAIERHGIKSVIFQTNAALLDLPDAAYARMLEVLISGLTATGVTRAAYVYLEHSERELARTAAIAALLTEMGAPLEAAFFENKAQAMAWCRAFSEKPVA